MKGLYVWGTIGAAASSSCLFFFFLFFLLPSFCLLLSSCRDALYVGRYLHIYCTVCGSLFLCLVELYGSFCRHPVSLFLTRLFFLWIPIERDGSGLWNKATSVETLSSTPDIDDITHNNKKILLILFLSESKRNKEKKILFIVLQTVLRRLRIKTSCTE